MITAQYFIQANDDLLHWTGYKLGYYFVKQYLLKTNQSITQATFASYRDFAIRMSYYR